MESVLNVPILNIRQVLQFRERQRERKGILAERNVPYKNSTQIKNTRLISMKREREKEEEIEN
jgi:hypothetical protein